PLDDVGRSALHRRVDGTALRILLQVAVARTDVREIEPPAEDGLDESAIARARARSLHVLANAGIATEVTPDVVLRGVALDAELAREPECRHAVDEPEIDRLRGAALVV